MPISYKKTVAIFDGVCAVEDAETLWNWLLEHPKGKVNLKNCTHIHSAIFQVLMKAQPIPSSLPEDEVLSAWVSPVLMP